MWAASPWRRPRAQGGTDRLGGEADVRLGSELSQHEPACPVAWCHRPSPRDKPRPDLAVRSARPADASAAPAVCPAGGNRGRPAPGASCPRLGPAGRATGPCVMLRDGATMRGTHRAVTRGLLAPGTPGCAFPDKENGAPRWKRKAAGALLGRQGGILEQGPRQEPPGHSPGPVPTVLSRGVFPRPSSLPFRCPQMSPFGES